MPAIANDNIARDRFFAGNIAPSSDDVDTNAALSDFVIALARNQARIDHLEAIGVNDNTRH
ncbi:hypothetical protein IVB34_14785 [Bradyrhizobium sp. 2]|uniref:hypothetical protein n=1 Tax=Bradyrhizobium sp. 2 TaxID=190045 RepID=UPI001FFB9D93|nr:hypothetical protein [Bradyrhizobium sp. 2]MCK1459620.1 hypothetical protein [Bradyrhizobium sp. 2]